MKLHMCVRVRVRARVRVRKIGLGFLGLLGLVMSGVHVVSANCIFLLSSLTLTLKVSMKLHMMSSGSGGYGIHWEILLVVRARVLRISDERCAWNDLGVWVLGGDIDAISVTVLAVLVVL